MSNYTAEQIAAIGAAVAAEREYLAADAEREQAGRMTMTPRQRRAVLATERTLWALSRIVPSRAPAQLVREAMAAEGKVQA